VSHPLPFETVGIIWCDFGRSRFKLIWPGNVKHSVKKLRSPFSRQRLADIGRDSCTRWALVQGRRHRLEIRGVQRSSSRPVVNAWRKQHVRD